ncbi:zinc knuckle (CCHC-type) family protein [Striga asiatica]|uniref:Zinc knuckle (CCHC-type) family protein n=1 Tax=Striga asiatica TaxID=4170 RepID=A0A5A7P4X0_STRAF|nr:zinc knuckle (CCHC-type) family protein [Striga asiatica]
MTEGGGAAPAVMTWTGRGRGRVVSSFGAFTMLLRTTGAAQKWVTPRANAGSTKGSKSPRETPTVAMKHRQSPQVNSSFRNPPHDSITNCHNISPSMVQDHALGTRCRARGVTQSNAIPLVLGRFPLEFRVSGF